MRIHGRFLRPTNLAERRLLLGHFGTNALRVPRKYNVFAIARRLERYVKQNADLAFVQATARRRTPVPPISPDLDLPEPVVDEDHVGASE